MVVTDKKKKVFGLIVSGVLGAAVITMGVLMALGVLPIRNIREEKQIYISTAEDLYELAEMSGYYDFSDAAIIMTADITVNEGNAEEWSTKAPERTWYPITGFAGTFDGQGHTISGIYGITMDAPMALFANTQKTAVIKDFHLRNSFFSSTGNLGIASISAVGGGSFERIYSDAIVECNGSNVAGMVSRVTDRLTVSECQFDGNIHNNNRVVGGIIDCVIEGVAVVEHCLFSGTIHSEWTTSGAKVGGLVGSLEQAGAILNLTDSLSSGIVKTGNDNYAASVLGVSYADSAAYFKNVFGCEDTYSYVVGCSGDKGTFMGDPISIASRYLKGYEGYRWTSLDFKEHWAVDLESTPVLQCFAKEIPDLSGVELPYSTAWYDEADGPEYTINTLEDLYGLYILSMENDFDGETIMLGADIAVNKGDAASWANNVPDNPWFPIRSFAGTFDGRKNTISGIYVNVTDKNIGLFSKTTSTSTIKNVRLTNSYFYNGTKSYANMGGIVGSGSGTFDTLYSEALMYCTGQNCGGIIGEIKELREHTISNCWFDGEIHMLTEDTGVYGAGIVANIASGMVDMEHCLNTGIISSEVKGRGVYLGGLCANIKTKSSELSIKDSLSAGTMQLQYYVCTGSILGRVQENTTVNFEDVYATLESYTRPTNSTFQPVGSNSKGEQNGAVIGYAQKRFIGNNGYQWTTLDFDKYWAIKKNGTPILKSFASEVPDISGLAKFVDTSWYDEKESTYVLKDMADLYGFYVISTRTDFQDKTIRLGANITVNKGNAASWAKSEPAYDWIPAGTSAKPFRGVFDGRGHSISGLYMKIGGTHLGLFGFTAKESTICNLSLKNSYFHSTHDKTTYLGSIAGMGNGNFDTIYSDAILVCDSTVAGGIVGQINEKDVGNTLNKCWFAGSLTMTSKKGANSGGLVGRINNQTITTISHCLNTGSLRSNLVGTGVFQGGLLGIGDKDAKITILDSLNTGTIDVDYSARVGTIVGGLNGDKTYLKITNTYAAKQDDEYLVFKSTKDAAGNTIFTMDSSGNYVIDNSKSPATFSINPVGGAAKTNIQEGSAVALDRDNLVGANAYASTILNFKTYWNVKENETPVLKAFSGNGTINMNNAIVADVSWFNPSATELVITNVNELFGMAVLAQTNDFAGKTIKLGASIMVNSGNAASWATQKPEYSWVPINSSAKPFAGTFDGQGYTISGLYINTNGQHIGLFAATAPGSVVKNLRLENSYMASSFDKATYIGSIAGLGNGDLNTVYSNAIVVCNGTVAGGLVGQINTKGVNNNITNCQFDGRLTMTKEAGQYAGGLVGRINNGTVTTISNCLNSGNLISKVYGTGAYLGGLIGAGVGEAVISISNSMNTGKLDMDYNVRVGTIVGGLSNTGTRLDVTGTYAAKQTDTVYKAGGKKDNNTATVTFAAFGGGASGTVQNGSATVMEIERLAGGNAYTNTVLDFNQYWAAISNSTPELLSFYRGKTMSLTGFVRADTSWYDASKSSFVINDAEDLYGLAVLSLSTDFAGKTVKLGNDITVNTQDANDWKGSAPNNVWTPIGSNSKPFAGIFDGQGYTISGIYVKSADQYLGLFGATGLDSEIKNFSLKNSYFEHTGKNAAAIIGSIAGKGMGNFETIYSDAVVVSNGDLNGGLIGQMQHASVNAANTCTVSNCWFAGTVTAKGQWTGGIVGRSINVSKTTIEHCLFTGKVTSTCTTAVSSNGGASLGGIIGSAYNQTIEIQDSLVTGNVILNDTAQGAGSVAGYNRGAALNVANVCATTESNEKTIGTGAFKNGDVVVKDKADLVGLGGGSNTSLDFKNYWVVLLDSTPQLKSFCAADTETLIDTSWYDEKESTFTLTTVGQLYGFASLSQTNSFQGKTILLGADITLNSGDASKWGKEAPANTWAPIGNNNNGGANRFRGTFDGQGHTISGLYIKGTDRIGLFGVTDTGAIVKNFSLVNSYFESTIGTAEKVATAMTGGIAGYVYDGTFENIYCSATIVAENGTQVGGILGVVNENKAASRSTKVSNCWFDGTVTAAGYAGGVVGIVTLSPNVTISNCLNTGSVKSTGVRAGGIVGYINDATTKFKVEHSLNVGSIEGVSQTGYVIGTISNAQVTADYVYAVLTEANLTTVGSGKLTSGSTIKKLALDKMAGTAALENMPELFETDEKGITFWITTDSTPVLKWKGTTPKED